MKTITISEAALDSIKRMGEADARRIAQLETYLRDIGRIMEDDLNLPKVAEIIERHLRVNTDSQSIESDQK